MNIVIDQGVLLSKEYKKALAPLLPNKKEPLELSAMKGLVGKPNETEPFVLITAVSTDVLKHHSEFLKRFKNSSQWIFIFVNNDWRGNEGVIGAFKDAAKKYDLLNCEFYSAPNLSSFTNVIQEISKKPIRKSNKVLFFTKHKRDDIVWLGQSIFGEDTSRYEYSFAGANFLDESEKIETDASLLVFCGNEIRDFKNISTLPDNMEPLFVFLNPEKHIQLYLNPEELVDTISAEFHMAEARVKSRLFFVSNAAELWKKNKSEGQEALERGIIMIDPFGLPISRKKYTVYNISQYIEKGYFDDIRLNKALKR